MNSLAVLVFVAGLVPAPKTEEADDNPFRNAKVGDWAEYKFTSGPGNLNFEGQVKLIVTAKSDKEATMKSVTSIMGKEQAGMEQKIDLTKPYNPLETVGRPAGQGAIIVKLGDGKETIKVGQREYDCHWTQFKQKISDAGEEIETTLWTSRTAGPAGIVKMSIKSKVINMSLELTGSGSK